MRRIVTAVLALALLIAPTLAVAQSNGPIRRVANMQTAAAATGNGVSLDTASSQISTIQTSGTFVGTVTFEASNDGTNWAGLYCALLASTNPITGVTMVTTSTAPNMYRCNTSGLALVRARVSAYTSGSITVTGLATSYPSGSGNGMAN